MANEKNLMSIEEVNSRRTPEQHSADSSKAGKASGEARRLKAAVRKALEQRIPGNMTELKEVLTEAGIDATNDNGIAYAILLQALKGDISAANWIRDTAGEKPKEELAIGGDSVIIISGDDKIAE